MVKSVNWGHHWDRLPTPAQGADCVAVDFATEKRGLVALGSERILETADGGRHWRVLRRGLGGLGELRDVEFGLPSDGAAGASAWVAAAHGVCRYVRAGGLRPAANPPARRARRPHAHRGRGTDMLPTFLRTKGGVARSGAGHARTTMPEG